jgi:hypothetical protein
MVVVGFFLTQSLRVLLICGNIRFLKEKKQAIRDRPLKRRDHHRDDDGAHRDLVRVSTWQQTYELAMPRKTKAAKVVYKT